MCRLQGLPEDFTDEMPFTTHGKRKVVGNGVPIPTGRAIARAVKRAISQERGG
jgi:site-specific DNA-cytosine methylase